MMRTIDILVSEELKTIVLQDSTRKMVDVLFVQWVTIVLVVKLHSSHVLIGNIQAWELVRVQTVLI